MNADAVGHALSVVYTAMCEAIGELTGHSVEPLTNHLIRATLEDGGPPEALAILQSLALDYPEDCAAPLLVPWHATVSLAAVQ